jgi:uncharacterized protein YbcI
MEFVPDHKKQSHGAALASLTNGVVQLLSESYGRGPTKAKSYLLDDRYAICVLEDGMTTAERTLTECGHGDLVRQVRLTFQGLTADAFKATAAEALGRPVLGYHSQISLNPDRSFEFFVLGD